MTIAVKSRQPAMVFRRIFFCIQRVGGGRYLPLRSCDFELVAKSQDLKGKYRPTAYSLNTKENAPKDHGGLSSLDRVWSQGLTLALVRDPAYT